MFITHFHGFIQFPLFKYNKMSHDEIIVFLILYRGNGSDLIPDGKTPRSSPYKGKRKRSRCREISNPCLFNLLK